MVKHRRTRAPGARACFHLLPFAFAKPNGVASYRFSNTIGTVLKFDVQIFVIGMCAEFPDQRVCRFS
jgi:hypothetical protein